jgi:nitronate monooxygenase
MIGEYKMWKGIVTRLLQVDYPIIQAPMAGGITTSELVGAVSNAGGLGMIGAGYMKPEQIRELIRKVKQLTTKTFGINLFVPNEFDANEEKIHQAQALLRPFCQSLSIQETEPNIPTIKQSFKNFQEQLDVIIEEQVPVLSFTFGIPSEEAIKKLKEQGILLIGTATTVEEAILNEKCGMDLVTVQGSEAGGHRGTFNGNEDGSLVGLISLIPQVVDQVKIPVIAAGGIMDGRGLSASFCLGAEAVQMGTAFLTCHESGTNPTYKDALLKATEEQTVLTRAFSGKWARGIKNEFINRMKESEKQLPSFPIQNSLTRQMRSAASIQNNPEFMSLWSGQSPRLAKKQTVRELMINIISEVEIIREKFYGGFS